MALLGAFCSAEGSVERKRNEIKENQAPTRNDTQARKTRKCVVLYQWLEWNETLVKSNEATGTV